MASKVSIYLPSGNSPILQDDWVSLCDILVDRAQGFEALRANSNLRLNLIHLRVDYWLLEILLTKMRRINILSWRQRSWKRINSSHLLLKLFQVRVIADIIKRPLRKAR
jgi:hypothetical protein